MRATGTGLQIAIANCAAFIATFTYLKADGWVRTSEELLQPHMFAADSRMPADKLSYVQSSLRDGPLHQPGISRAFAYPVNHDNVLCEV